MSLEIDDPFLMFGRWLKEAEASEPNDANAMALSTVDPEGMPSTRMVLLKDFDAQGFVFYTNLGSQKARELAQNPRAALLFHWKSLQRQIRIQGVVVPVDAAEADAYFASRHRDSRIGAWASKQSQAMQGRWELEKRVAAFALKFGVGEIPRPEFWSGFRLAPQVIEFWKAGAFRLHDRVRLERQADGGWSRSALFP
jgi:pyridoxamine 5'-phosphate oxidase